MALTCERVCGTERRAKFDTWFIFSDGHYLERDAITSESHFSLRPFRAKVIALFFEGAILSQRVVRNSTSISILSDFFRDMIFFPTSPTFIQFQGNSFPRTLVISVFKAATMRAGPGIKEKLRNEVGFLVCHSPYIISRAEPFSSSSSTACMPTLSIFPSLIGHFSLPFVTKAQTKRQQVSRNVKNLIACIFTSEKMVEVH